MDLLHKGLWLESVNTEGSVTSCACMRHNSFKKLVYICSNGHQNIKLKAANIHPIFLIVDIS